MKTKIYNLATRVYDWNIPILTQLADWIREMSWTYDEHDDYA